MKIEKTLINEQVTNAIETETRPPPRQNRGKEWAKRLLRPADVAAFELLTNEERLAALEELGSPCSRCGDFGSWCCYDPAD